MTNPESDPIVDNVDQPKAPDPRPAPQPAPVFTPEPTVNNPRTGDNDDAPNWARELQASIKAMPEHMVNAIRESAPPKNSDAPPLADKSAADTKSEPAPGDKPKRSFADKWFR